MIRSRRFNRVDPDHVMGLLYNRVMSLMKPNNELLNIIMVINISQFAVQLQKKNVQTNKGHDIDIL